MSQNAYRAQYKSNGVCRPFLKYNVEVRSRRSCLAYLLTAHLHADEALLMCLKLYRRNVIGWKGRTMNVRFLLGISLLLLMSCGTSSQEAPSIRLAVTRGSLLYLPVYLAGPLGFFQQEGVSVTLEETASAPKSMQSPARRQQ
jgi:hypothetical protein